MRNGNYIVIALWILAVLEFALIVFIVAQVLTNNLMIYEDGSWKLLINGCLPFAICN